MEINIPTVEYEIGNSGYRYRHIDHVIELNSNYENYDTLTDDELLIEISDSIVHEFIHHVLLSMYDRTITGLFDLIDYHFYQRYDLYEKVLKKSDFFNTWQESVKEKGMEYFYIRHGITKEDLKFAYKLVQK